METEQQEETFTNTETNGKFFFKGLFYWGEVGGGENLLSLSVSNYFGML